ncbi:MAG TPA: hypothetical protein DDY31_02490 [Lachnospiraceae bacterium]|nr:hypothetical protein [Lachnospiraceae bacterium]
MILFVLFFWDDKNVDVWYRQNTVLFVKDGVDIEKCYFRKVPLKAITDIVHPELLYSRTRIQADKLINRRYLYVHYRKLYLALRKAKRLFVRGHSVI